MKCAKQGLAEGGTLFFIKPFNNNKMKIYLILLTSILLTTCASGNITKDKDTFENMIRSGKDILIQNQTFDKDIDFTQFEKNLISEGIYQVRISSSITFVNCTFNGKVIAYARNEDQTETTITSFLSNLSFLSCDFNDEVNFKASSILGRTDFTLAAFTKTTNFEECTFFQNAYFRNSSYHEEARFQNAVFMQKANFLSAEFDVTVSFQNAVFHSEAQFSSARFMGYTDFGLISCYGNFLVNYSEFADRTIINNAYFGGRAEINNVSFNTCEIQNSRFFGVSRFVGSTVIKQISFDNSFFLMGIPEMDSFEKDKLSMSGVK